MTIVLSHIHRTAECNSATTWIFHPTHRHTASYGKWKLFKMRDIHANVYGSVYDVYVYFKWPLMHTDDSKKRFKINIEQKNIYAWMPEGIHVFIMRKNQHSISVIVNDVLFLFYFFSFKKKMKIFIVGYTHGMHSQCDLRLEKLKRKKKEKLNCSYTHSRDVTAVNFQLFAL